MTGPDRIAIEARKAWYARGGPKAVRDKLIVLKKLLDKATGKAKASKDPRTQIEHAKKLTKFLDCLSASEHPTDVETVLELRVACSRVGVQGGLSCDLLPRDLGTLSQVVAAALELLPEIRSKTATKVNGWALLSAAERAGSIENITREAYKDAVGESKQEGQRGGNVAGDAVEKNATRLKEAGVLVDTPLGKVAGTFRKVALLPPPKK